MGRATARPGDDGFTLLDLLLVLTVMGLLAAIPATSMTDDGWRADAVARAIVADLVEARSLAIATRRAVGVEFDVADRACRFVLGDGRTPAEAAAALRVDAGLTVADVDALLDATAHGDPVLDGAVLTAVDFAGTDRLVFEADGSPRDGGFVEIAAGAVRRRIRAQAGSGRLAITEP